MTTPAQGPLDRAAPLPDAAPPTVPHAAPAGPADDEEHGVLGWARAIAFGLRDTAHDMLDEGRRGAAAAYDEGWQRFDKKTRGRRAAAGEAKRRRR
ncbi:MAG: hypothetical protein ACKVT1_19345 [Dehalococcoidia bacterium]